MQSNKIYIIANQKLMTEWDFEKNSVLGLDPNIITTGSHKNAWWKCIAGHSWPAVVKSRVNGNGCKYCAGQGFTPERSLAVRFPEIANEWDNDRNGDLSPSTVTYGQKIMINWICPVGHSYPALISNRTCQEKKGCPYCCHNPKLNTENNLAVRSPIIAKEWDYELNEMSPNDILPHSNKMFHWICPSKGHHYPATANNRTNGYGCPYCSGQKACDDNSLATINPELAKEWHPTKNKKTFDEITSGSNQYAWWKCERGHEWRAKINNRNNGKGCKECAKGTQSSFPEQAIYFYLKQIYPSTLNGYKFNNTEIDIFIPELRIAIEYDGYRYHNSNKKLNSDLRKNIIFISGGLNLIRVREKGCAEMDEKSYKIIECIYKSDYSYLNKTISTLINEIASISNQKDIIEVDIKKDRNTIIALYRYALKERSLLSVNPILASEWDYEGNYPLTPDMFLPGTELKVKWICSKNHEHKWESLINSRNSGVGCRYCAGKK